MKTEGELYWRTDSVASLAGWASVGFTLLTVSAVPFVQPSLRLNFAGHPIEYLLPLSGLLALGGTLYLRRRKHDTAAFLASSLFILAMLGGVLAGCIRTSLSQRPIRRSA